MGARYLLDTNTGIDLLANRLPVASAAWVERQLAAQQLSMSVIVRIELLSWKGSPAAMQLLLDFINEASQLPLDEPVILQTIQLRQQRRIKLPDAIIAATALVHGLPLITRNVADFQGVAGLVVINPHGPAPLPLA
jgi:predicted nucleic acid-binding protein